MFQTGSDGFSQLAVLLQEQAGIGSQRAHILTDELRDFFQDEQCQALSSDTMVDHTIDQLMQLVEHGSLNGERSKALAEIRNRLDEIDFDRGLSFLFAVEDWSLQWILWGHVLRLATTLEKMGRLHRERLRLLPQWREDLFVKVCSFNASVSDWMSLLASLPEGDHWSGLVKSRLGEWAQRQPLYRCDQL